MRLFISYSRIDSEICEKIVKLLEAHEVWFDQKLQAGDLWWQMILERIDWCDGFVYLLSNDSIISEYCIKEFKVAQALDKRIIPVMIRKGTDLTGGLRDIQYVYLGSDFEKNLWGVVELLNALLIEERRILTSPASASLEDLSEEELVSPDIDESEIVSDSLYSLPINITAHFSSNLSKNSVRAYCRWVCHFLNFVVGVDILKGVEEKQRYLSSVPTKLLESSLNVARVSAWLGKLDHDGNVDLNQPKAATGKLVEYLVQQNIVDKSLRYKIKEIDVSYAARRKSTIEILSNNEINQLVDYVKSLPTHEASIVRDVVIVGMSMILRSGELSKAKWKNIHFGRDEVYCIHPKTNKATSIPTFAQKYLKIWHDFVQRYQLSNTVDLESYLIRATNGQYIENDGLTSHSITGTVKKLGEQAGIGYITTDILRKSVREIGQNYDLSELY